MPFASFDYRKLDDPTFTPKDMSNELLPRSFNMKEMELLDKAMNVGYDMVMGEDKQIYHNDSNEIRFIRRHEIHSRP